MKEPNLLQKQYSWQSHFGPQQSSLKSVPHLCLSGLDHQSLEYLENLSKLFWPSSCYCRQESWESVIFHWRHFPLSQSQTRWRRNCGARNRGGDNLGRIWWSMIFPSFTWFVLNFSPRLSQIPLILGLEVVCETPTTVKNSLKWLLDWQSAW